MHGSKWSKKVIQKYYKKKLSKLTRLILPHFKKEKNSSTLFKPFIGAHVCSELRGTLVRSHIYLYECSM